MDIRREDHVRKFSKRRKVFAKADILKGNVEAGMNVRTTDGRCLAPFSAYNSSIPIDKGDI